MVWIPCKLAVTTFLECVGEEEDDEDDYFIVAGLPAATGPQVDQHWPFFQVKDELHKLVGPPRHEQFDRWSFMVCLYVVFSGLHDECIINCIFLNLHKFNHRGRPWKSQILRSPVQDVNSTLDEDAMLRLLDVPEELGRGPNPVAAHRNCLSPSFKTPLSMRSSRRNNNVLTNEQRLLTMVNQSHHGPTRKPVLVVVVRLP